MAGFFKKLFNRITGRKEDAAPEPEQAALPAPEPALPPEPVAEEPEPSPVTDDFQPEPVPEPPVRAEKAPAAKAPARKTVTQPPVEIAKPKAGKAAPKKPETKSTIGKTAAAPKKIEEPKKPEPKLPARKAAAPKIAEPKAAPVKSAKGKAAAKVTTKAKAEPAKPVPKARPKPAKTIQPAPQPAPHAPPEEVVDDAVPPFEPVPHVPEPALPPPPPIPEPVVIPEPAADLAAPEPEPEPPSPPPPPPLPRPVKSFSKAQVPVPAPVALPEPEKKGWLSRLKDGLSKSSKSLTESITAIFTKRKLDKDTLQDLEDTLIQADLGVAVAERIIKAVATGRYDKEIDPQEVKQILAQEVAKVLKPVEVPFNFGEEKPFVILVVGVNGSGKTTTIGKLGAIAAGEGFKVKFVACDTFRAAAIEQLTVWGKRIGVETMSRPQGADASGLAYDAMKESQDDGTDIMFIDTAGRLHNKTYLMDELDKVVRVIKKYDANAPHAVLLVLDATTGQNAMAQADAFTKVAGVTGLIMTKLDGTARGGILVAIAEAYKLPIHAIGVGETIDDLQPFDADAFARAIAGLDET